MDFLSEAQALFPETVAFRRQFHQHPELAFSEFETARIVSEELKRLGYSVLNGIGTTGVTGFLGSTSVKPLIMMRFDMDALPIQEASGAEYASQTLGVMHACGHDAHTAIGLTTARLIAKHHQDLDVSFLLVFQPAEEIGQGALAMLEDGLFSAQMPDFALGVHVWNSLPSGSFVIKTGELMAGSGMFTIRVLGKGGHAALPHQAINPIAAGAQIVTTLHNITAQSVNPLEAAVVGVTMFHAGTANNIIPEQAELQGTIRFFSGELWHLLNQKIQTVARDTASAFGCEVEISLLQNTPPLVNNAAAALAAQTALKRILPEAALLTDYRTMGSEDMALFLEKVPGVFIFVGSGGQVENGGFPHHHPCFDIDESVLPYSCALLLQTAVEMISSNKQENH